MPPATIANRYHVLRELGRGGMGVVYQVLHKETGGQYALKVLLAHTATKGESVERFKREVKLPARIQSEHVVQVIDSGEAQEEGGAPFYVMELLRGCDLRQLIDAKHAFTPQEILWILRQVAQGLGQAHAVGIVHRDLKPDNIFLHSQSRAELLVKILDFGIARYAQDLLDTGDHAKLTATQAMLGTPLYMAPEQAKAGEGRAEIGPCTDVWAVGMIVFELLTGKTYWNSNSIVQHIGQLLFGKMVPPSQRAPELPAGFDAWFFHACDRDGEKRYASVGEQIDELARLLGLSLSDGPPPSALLSAVRAKMPSLVDHRGATMTLELPPEGLEEPTRVFDQSAIPHGSDEQKTPAEIFPSAQEDRRQIRILPIALRSRAMLGGVLISILGMTIIVLLVARRQPASDGASSAKAKDLSAGTADMAEPRDLVVQGERTASHPEPHPAVTRHPPATETRRPSRSKGVRPSPPREETSKSRRTYIPPSL